MAVDELRPDFPLVPIMLKTAAHMASEGDERREFVNRGRGPGKEGRRDFSYSSHFSRLPQNFEHLRVLY
jgi:hypothetical protein